MSDLIKELKLAMNYSENEVSCRICKHYVEREGFIDRSWDSFCTFNSIVDMPIRPDGRCSKFVLRSK